MALACRNIRAACQANISRAYARVFSCVASSSWVRSGGLRACYIFAAMRVQDSGQGEPGPRSDASLHEFFGRGETFVRQLIAENARLRSELQTDHRQGDEPSEPAPASVIESLMARVAELEHEREAAPSNLESAAPSITDDDTAALIRRVEHLELESYHLASMYVAGLQFHSARTLTEVLQTITEVLLNFVGVGAFTLFVLDEERKVLFALSREGGDLEACGEVPIQDAGPLATMVQRARPWTRGDPAYADDAAIMYLPLVSNRRLVAVLRLESFLAQKPGFEENDYSLLSMISEHAGIAIETAWIRAHAKAALLQRQAVEQLVGA